MNTKTDAHLSSDFEEYFLPWYHLGMVDAITRRVERPNEFRNDKRFFDRLIEEGDSFIMIDGDIGLCLFQQAYEVARDSESLGLTEWLLAANRLNNRGFSELAFPMFAEIANKAIAEKDSVILDDLLYPLSQTSLLVRREAMELATLIEDELLELMPPAPKKPRKKQSN